MKKRVGFGLILIAALVFSVMPIFSVKAAETLVWEGVVSSNGTPVTTPTLEAGVTYRIVVEPSQMFLGAVYADAQYYTSDLANWWVWSSGSQLDSHSFLQINNNDVDWGPFNNGWGDPLTGPYGGHSYEITFVGTGAPITLRIYDWSDLDYTNNTCHQDVKIYREEGEGDGFTPGFWKHNIGVLFLGNPGSPSSFTEDGPHLTAAQVAGYLATAGYTAQSAYDALTAKGPGSEIIRMTCANALNAAAGFGPYIND